MKAPGVAASSLSREEAMALVTEVVAVQTAVRVFSGMSRLERMRAELRRLIDEG
jgi:hypothetical protein